MTSDRPFESTHWETVTERETDHGREVVRTGVETRPLPQSYIDRARAGSRVRKRRLAQFWAALLVLLGIGSLGTAVLASVALGIGGLLVAGALAGWVAWWYRRPEKGPIRMVYFRRYGPFRTWTDYDDEVSPYRLEVAAQTFHPDEKLWKMVARIEWGEVYHMSNYRIVEVRDRDGTVVYHDPDETGWREEERAAPATTPTDRDTRNDV